MLNTLEHLIWPADKSSEWERMVLGDVMYYLKMVNFYQDSRRDEHESDTPVEMYYIVIWTSTSKRSNIHINDCIQKQIIWWKHLFM